MLFKGIETLQIKLLYPASPLVQLLEGYTEYFIKVEGRKDSYIAKGNTTQQQSRVEPVTWSPSNRQGELDDLILEQETAESRRKKDTWTSNEQR